MSKNNKNRASTMSALLEEKTKRGRPPLAVSRQNVYVALSDEQKAEIKRLASLLPKKLKRADVPDLAISILTARLESLRRALADRNREIPEGVTDLESIYLLWDLSLPPHDLENKWTSIRVSPQQNIELGRAHGTLNAAFGSNRSDTFSLGLSLLTAFLEERELQKTNLTLGELRQQILDIYL
jgi:hypothetical protein